MWAVEVIKQVIDVASESARFFAQAGSNDAGAVGNLVAATLQTAGVYAQADILSRFSGALTKLAALCFLCSIIAAVTATAVYGAYRRGLYLLVGPALFFFVVQTKAPVQGAQVKMGERVVPGSVEDQVEFMKKHGNSADYSGNAQVSWLFLQYDKIVSSVVQDTIKVIGDTKNNEDLVFRARERALSWVLLAQPDQPGFVSLVSSGYIGKCGQLLWKIQEAKTHKKDPFNPVVEGNLNEVGEKLLTQYNDLAKKTRVALDPDTVPFVRKDPKKQREYSEYNYSCQEIWDSIAVVAREFAGNQLDFQKSFLGSASTDGQIPWDKVQEDVKKTLAGEAGESGKTADPADVLAAYIIKNIVLKTPHQAMMSNVFDKSPFLAERKNMIYDGVAGTEQYAGYIRMAAAVATLPYVQGVMLYILAVLFPFFAVFLVMPGRATTFLLWMSLWAWIKSWDIGFTMVNVARKLMWQFVARSVNPYGEAIALGKPESVLSLIGEADPLATENSYITVVAILFGAVPIITGYFCLGATEFFSAFKLHLSGIDRFGQQATRAAKRKFASEAENLNQQRAIAAGLKNAMAVQQAPGFTEDGQDLSQRGDASLQVKQAAAFQKGVVEYHMSAEGIRNAALLGALTTRTSVFDYSMGNRIQRSMIDNLRLSLQGAEYGQGHGLGGDTAPIRSAVQTPGQTENDVQVPLRRAE